MFLTYGIFYDLNENIISWRFFFTLSFIIIGVGNTDCLDSDDNPLGNSRVLKDVWDLVQFFPFLKYDNYLEHLVRGDP